MWLALYISYIPEYGLYFLLMRFYDSFNNNAVARLLKLVAPSQISKGKLQMNKDSTREEPGQTSSK